MKARLGANLIFVKDVRKSKDWYKKVLGMNVVDYRPPEFLEMKLGRNIFYIESYNDKRAAGFRKVKIGGRSSIVFAVGDIHKFIEKMKKLRVRIIVQPVQQIWGGWNAVIADPDGNEFVIDQDN